MKVVQLVLRAFFHRIMGETLVLMSVSSAVIMFPKKQSDGISEHVQAGPGDHCLVRILQGHYLSKIHSGEEEHLCKLRKSPRSGPSHRMVLLPQVFDNICREFSCPLVVMFVTRMNLELPFMNLSFQNPRHGRRILFTIHGTT